ncbi:hypothetical protein RS030_192953 [Cryptosporidium xiaoi]|uniref:Uncharacterized protein n=1 Tax=Cryptosporidium xiaoi TaxID=659607 RepID=A0AAV9XYX3_9CRYT
MSEESDQFTVTGITNEAIYDESMTKDPTFWILESKKEISTVKDVYYGLREGLRANCADKNNSQVEEKLKYIIPAVSTNSDLQFENGAVTEQSIEEKTQVNDIMKIIEKSSELGKENIQRIDGVDVTLSGFGGKPFASSEKNIIKSELTLDQRVKASEEMDELLLSTLKSLVEVNRLNNNVNFNTDINFNPNSNISKSLGEMKEMLTNMFLRTFNPGEHSAATHT